MEPQEVFNNWARLRAEKHFDEGIKRNHYPEDCEEYKAYNDRWAELEYEQEQIDTARTLGEGE